MRYTFGYLLVNFNPIWPRGGGLYDSLFNHCLISDKFVSKRNSETTWIFLHWFYLQFKKMFEVDCMYESIFTAIWNCLLKNLLSRFSEDLRGIQFLHFNKQFSNVCHLHVFESRNFIFGIQPSIMKVFKKINQNWFRVANLSFKGERVI